MVNIGVNASIDGQKIYAVFPYRIASLKYIAGGKKGNLRDSLKKRLKKEYKNAGVIEVQDFQILNTLETKGLHEAG